MVKGDSDWRESAESWEPGAACSVRSRLGSEMQGMVEVRSWPSCPHSPEGLKIFSFKNNSMQMKIFYENPKKIPMNKHIYLDLKYYETSKIIV